MRSLFVERPNGGVHLLFKSDRKVPLLLYPAGTEDTCNGSSVAEGTAVFTDVASNLFGGPGRGTSGFRIRGTVTDLAGERHHVLVVVHSQLGPNGFQDLVTKIHDATLRAGKFLGATSPTYASGGPSGRTDTADFRMFQNGPSFDGYQPPARGTRGGAPTDGRGRGRGAR